MIDDTTQGWGTLTETGNHRVKEVEIRGLEGCGGMNLWAEYESGESCIVKRSRELQKGHLESSGEH